MMNPIASLLLTVGFLALHGSTYAQVAIGFRAGVSWSNMAFLDVDDDAIGDVNWETTASVSPAFAVLADLPFGQRFSVVPEFAYVGRGYVTESSANPFGGADREKLRLDYLDVNLLGKYVLGQEPARPHLLLGPTFGRVLGGRYLYEEDNGDFENGSSFDPGDAGMAEWNLGLCAGAGFSFSLGSTALFVEGRYQYGFTNIWNGVVLSDLNGATIGELNSFDRSWSFHIGWTLPVPGKDAAVPEPSVQ